jgi:hypothetical protein
MAFTGPGIDLSDKGVFGRLGGRIMAALVLCLLFWFTLAHDRQEAKDKLRRMTRTSYAADYEKERTRIKETAEESDGYLLGITTILGCFVLIYEGGAFAFGWGLSRLIEHPKE